MYQLWSDLALVNPLKILTAASSVSPTQHHTVCDASSMTSLSGSRHSRQLSRELLGAFLAGDESRIEGERQVKSITYIHHPPFLRPLFLLRYLILMTPRT